MKSHYRKYLPGYSYEDYKEWVGEWELIYGIPYAMSGVNSITHQDIKSKIIFELIVKLKVCIECEALSEVDWIVDDDTIVRADSMVVCDLRDENHISKAPELIFEVLSPPTLKKDRDLKSLLYAQNGVKYYVLLEADEKFAEVYILQDNKYILEGVFKRGEYNFKLSRCSFLFSFRDIFTDV